MALSHIHTTAHTTVNPRIVSFLFLSYLNTTLPSGVKRSPLTDKAGVIPIYKLTQRILAIGGKRNNNNNHRLNLALAAFKHAIRGQFILEKIEILSEIS